MVDNGVTGFVCPIHDAKAYADAIIRILSDLKLREKMGAAGRSRYEQRYTNEQFIKSIERVFRELR